MLKLEQTERGKLEKQEDKFGKLKTDQK